MIGYIRLLRPGNCLMGVIATVIAAVIFLGDHTLLQDAWPRVVLASLTVVAFTGAGNALNDYYDRENDRVNHPERPIPSGNAGAGGALFLSFVLFVLAVALSIFINVWAVLVVIINLAFMISYEVKLKRVGLAGNLEISWLTASLFIFGAFSVFDGNWESMSPIWILALLGFISTLGREISKDIQDVQGDADRVTLPKTVGIRKAGDLAIMAFLSGIALSPLPYILGIFGWHYLALVVLADATFIYSASILEKDPAGASEGAKLAMYVALAAFLVGGLV